jgi:hypothetical protein
MYLQFSPGVEIRIQTADHTRNRSCRTDVKEVHEVVSDNRLGYLEELVHELGSRGLTARVVRTRSGPDFLRVCNPEAASLAENVTCAPAPDSSEHYYWWSWGELMHRVDDPGGAARKVAHVLEVYSY